MGCAWGRQPGVQPASGQHSVMSAQRRQLGPRRSQAHAARHAAAAAALGRMAPRLRAVQLMHISLERWNAAPLPILRPLPLCAGWLLPLFCGLSGLSWCCIMRPCNVPPRAAALARPAPPLLAPAAAAHCLPPLCCSSFPAPSFSASFSQQQLERRRRSSSMASSQQQPAGSEQPPSSCTLAC